MKFSELDNAIRMPEYNVNRCDARRLVKNAKLQKNSEIILDLRGSTFFGRSFSQEIASQIAKKNPTRITFIGGNKRMRDTISQPLMRLRVPIGVRKTEFER